MISSAVRVFVVLIVELHCANKLWTKNENYCIPKVWFKSKSEVFIKGQIHNKGELTSLELNIESHVVKKIEEMASNTDYSVDEIAVIALKRFISSHCDFLNKAPSISIDS
tara:strand:- start:2331 stop:2660 length:330 start_codon:yes stop_codon:yes gene_type:complete